MSSLPFSIVVEPFPRLIIYPLTFILFQIPDPQSDRKVFRCCPHFLLRRRQTFPPSNLSLTFIPFQIPDPQSDRGGFR